jgi:uncharacterized protein (DUF1800 family)
MTKKIQAPNVSRREILQLGSLITAWTALTSCTSAQNIVDQFSDEALQPTNKPTTQLTPTPALDTDVPVPDSPLPTAPPPPTEAAIRLHTLRRMSFGVTTKMIARAESIGLEAFVEEQLNPEALDTNELERQIGKLEVMNSTATELFQSEQRGRLVGEFIMATLTRQLRNPRQFYEITVDFWTNHFNIYLLGGVTGLLKIFDDRDVIRPNALGTFPELLRASVHSPAMLTYLDQAQSTREAPNENYARELLELHTVGVDGGYTHFDIKELARALTGWSVTGRREVQAGLEAGQFIFRQRLHDPGEKQVLGYTIPAESGLRGGEDFLDFLANHPNTSQFIARKMATRFVADDPPQSIIAPLAETFQSTNGDIRAMLRTLIFSDEFAASSGQKIKRPLEFFISVLRVTGAEIDPQRGRLRDLTTALKMLGQVPYQWSPPNGYPDFSAWWLTTSGMLNRWNFAMHATTGGLRGMSIPLRSLLRTADSPADVVDVLSLEFLGSPLPPDARDILVAFVSDGNLDETVPAAAGLILGSPYFQVR